MCYLIFAAVVILSPLPSSDVDLASLLPADGIPDGWAAVEEHRSFEGQALFTHINGGAELYHKYGFVNLVLKDYSKGKLEARVEIYDMGSPEGAAGVFAENTVGLETGSEYGEGCSLDPLQIIFYRDRYYVSITCYEVDEELQAAVSELAGAVDNRINKL